MGLGQFERGRGLLVKGWRMIHRVGGEELLGAVMATSF